MTYADAYLGNPLTTIATSVEVPPISTTTASLMLLSLLAPLRELVGPQENVRKGNFLASSAEIRVPSF